MVRALNCCHGEKLKTLLIDRLFAGSGTQKALVHALHPVCAFASACVDLYLYVYYFVSVCGCVCDVVMSQLCYRNREALCPHD